MRKYRKREHIESFLRSSFLGNPLFEDVFLPHNSLPECDFDEIDTSTRFLNKKINFPLMINAMTGGSEFTEDINRQLAEIAREFNIPMAVGSQTITLEDEDSIESFKIVREIMGDSGVILGNLSGRASLKDVKFAVDMLKADGIQIHLNPAQELAMEEGERSFKGILSNIEEIVKGSEVPVIVKEVGFGMSRDVARRLYSVGVRHIDVSGFGGTNFMEVENLRRPENDLSELYSWGIPTALSLLSIKNLNLKDLSLISSGGIKNSMDLIKSLVLGADMAAMSGEILSYLIHGGYEYTMEYLENIMYKAKIIMLLTGSKNVEELKKLPFTISGTLKELSK